jgi:ATP-binding cassette subfamily B multidrug efflux pump
MVPAASRCDVRFLRIPARTRPALDGVTLRCARPHAGPGRADRRGQVDAAAPAAAAVRADSGSVRWGGVALPDYTLAALRAAIAWVPQEPFLFSASVAENIALAGPARRAKRSSRRELAAVHDDIRACRKATTRRSASAA